MCILKISMKQEVSEFYQQDNWECVLKGQVLSTIQNSLPAKVHPDKHELHSSCSERSLQNS